jgi:CRP-like cAMP-binding protein
MRRGCAKLFLSASNGNEKTLDIIRPGMALAEIPMFTEESPNHYCNCMLLEDCELFEFNSSDYLRLLQQHPAYTLPLMRALGEKIQQQAAEIADLTLTDARQRLTQYIFSQIECSDKHECDPIARGCDINNSCGLRLPTAKSTIASLLSIQRETFSRLLGKMKAEQMIAVHGSQIQVTNLRKLREYSN